MPDLRYFGEAWNSAIADEGTLVPTPVGTPCLLCASMILDEDRGLYYIEEPVHRECNLRSIVGGIGHIINHEYWCIQCNDPDAGLTYRQSANVVWGYIALHGIPKS